MNHLTAVGLGTGAMPGIVEEEEKDVKCVNCEKGGSCFLETIMGW